MNLIFVLTIYSGDLFIEIYLLFFVYNDLKHEIDFTFLGFI